MEATEDDFSMKLFEESRTCPEEDKLEGFDKPLVHEGLSSAIVFLKVEHLADFLERIGKRETVLKEEEIQDVKKRLGLILSSW